MALTDKLSAIGIAIREKTGGSELLTLDAMPDEIRGIQTGGGELPEEALIISGDCSNKFGGTAWNWYIDYFGRQITTKDITNCERMFTNNRTLENIPFDINLKEGTAVSMNEMFNSCENLKHIPDITYRGSYNSMNKLFYNCYSLEEVPYIYNAYPSTMNNLFYMCRLLREIPEDYFDTWDFSRMKATTNGYSQAMFESCYSLRKLPRLPINDVESFAATYYSYSIYNYFVRGCNVLDEVKDLPVLKVTYTSNAFNYSFAACYRLKRLTFSVNEDGSPKTANWKSQTISLDGAGSNEYYNTMSYSSDNWTDEDITRAIRDSGICSYNSGITADKAIYNAATYQALKNDPDAFSLHSTYQDNYRFSRYNKDSAVETINSLPDTSAYLSTNGGTNTIKFRGNAGAATDGGAINTMTEEEIAVAAAKGWTVTLA